MASTLPPAKVVLLAVHFAAHADIGSLATLTKAYTSIIHDDLLLRILLTHLPETITPVAYVGFLQNLAGPTTLTESQHSELDTSPINNLDDHVAARRATKLHLLPLSCPGAPEMIQEDALSRFLYLRAHRMDDETGMLSQLLDLLFPFLRCNPGIHKWTMCTVLPYVRKGLEYHSGTPPEYSLHEFEKLPERQAVEYLLSAPVPANRLREKVDDDLRSVIAPWLYDTDRWDASPKVPDDPLSGIYCAGWQQVREWLLSQATLSWPIAVQAMEHWDGPEDVDFSQGTALDLPNSHSHFLKQTYATTILACVYSIQEATLEYFARIYSVLAKLRIDLGHVKGAVSLEEAVKSLPDLAFTNPAAIRGDRIASYMRNNLLERDNPLTKPSKESTDLLLALVISAYILTLFGLPSTVRRVGDLMLLRDLRDQRSEVLRFLRTSAGQASSKNDDDYLLQARSSLLWLLDWGHNADGVSVAGAAEVCGALGMVSREYVEAEFLKLLLSRGHYNLARSLYEDGGPAHLSADIVRESVYQSALSAFDNATNPNRTRGGLKRCDEIIHSFPKSVDQSLPGTKQILSLLKVTHALGEYRLVLKQGEPFSPVVLRVHSDPVSIVDKVLEQNPRAYTRIQEFLEMGMDMVQAGLPSSGKRDSSIGSIAASKLSSAACIAERRITAMCIEAALKEDDFETACSYVASRLSMQNSAETEESPCPIVDEWSWKAALRAGQYIRTERSQPPTHLGTASGNPEIRHLEQRLECLATALRVAPTCQLQEILKSFRRCEEQLDSAIKEEAAKEAAWDSGTGGDSVPGAFDHSAAEKRYAARSIPASAGARQTEEAPMSLFDLSRATARAAQRNFTAIPSLQSITHNAGSNSEHEAGTSARVRKRDQLREAATGTLVSGVGWLIGANVTHSKEEGT